MFYAVNTSRRLPVDEGEPPFAFPLPTFIIEAENPEMAHAIATQIADTFEPIQVAEVRAAFIISSEMTPRFGTPTPEPAYLVVEEAIDPEPLAPVVPLFAGARCTWSTPAVGHPDHLARCGLGYGHGGGHVPLPPGSDGGWPEETDRAEGHGK